MELNIDKSGTENKNFNNTTVNLKIAVYLTYLNLHTYLNITFGDAFTVQINNQIYRHCDIPIASWYAIPFFEPNFSKRNIHIHLQETKFTVKSMYIPQLLYIY
jgi:hypothetical protein